MASGHVSRTQRPNTWLHRPSLRREDSPCQLGAVHTWPVTDLAQYPLYVRCWRDEQEVTRTFLGSPSMWWTAPALGIDVP